MSYKYPPEAFAYQPVLRNVVMTLADTEYSLQLPVNTMKFLIKMADDSEFYVAFNTLNVPPAGGPYLTVPANRGGYWEDHVNLQPNDAAWDGTLYFSSASADMTAQILAWVNWT